MSKGNFNTKPPLLNGSNYSYWKGRMIVYLWSIHYNLWDNVVKGLDVPKTIIDGKTINKPLER